MMRKLPMVRKMIVPLVLALMFAACGGDEATTTSTEEDPKQALFDALDATADFAGHTIVLTLESDPASLQALSTDEGGEPLSNDDAIKVLESSLEVSGVQAEDPADSTFSLAANLAGLEDAVELRYVDQTLYVRADVRGVLETFNQNPAQADQLAQQAQAGGLSFVKPLIDGKWLALTGLKQLMEQAGVASTPTQDQQRLVEEMTSALKSSSTVTSAGSDEAGDHLVATIPLRDAYRQFTDLTKGLGQLPQGADLPPASEVPDKNIVVDAWVNDGTVSQIEFDFLQLGDITEEPPPAGVEKFALRMTLAEFDGAIEAPTGATEVDLRQILQGFLSGLGGTAGGAGGAAGAAGGAHGGPGDAAGLAAFCDALKDQPASVQQQYAAQCP